jgi:L-fuconolactonase
MARQIDSHHHLWRYNDRDYVWMSSAMSLLRRDYLPDELKANLEGAGIDGTVVVQARQSLKETRWLLEVAAQHRFIHGVVGWVPLIVPEVGDILAHLAGDRNLKAVRHVLHDEPEDDYMLRYDFNRGIGRLRAHGLVYDVLIFSRHLENAIRLVDRHQDQPFVIDHIAKPLISAREFDDRWAAQIRELARRDCVACKLSGVVTEVRDPAWTVELIRPYFETVLDAFGADRLMFGSDWPVCLLRCGYGDWVATVRDLIRSLSDVQQARIMGGNACRVYGLDVE